MPEFVPPPADQVQTPHSYASEPARHVEYATLPPDVTMRPEGIHFKDNILVVSVATMVFTSLITFYIPFFNGLLGGAFGGFHAGRMKRALAAAVANSIIVPGILLLAYAFDTPDLLRFFSGLGVGGWLALHIIGTFIGAVSGAYSRPLVSDRNMFRYAEVSGAPIPRSGAAPVSPRTEKSP